MLKFVMTPLLLLASQVAFCQAGKTKIKVSEGTDAVVKSTAVYNKPIAKPVEEVSDVPEQPQPQLKPKASSSKELLASANTAPKPAAMPVAKPNGPKPEMEAITTKNADGTTVTILRVKKVVDTVATTAANTKNDKKAKAAAKKADTVAKAAPVMPEPKIVPPKITRQKLTKDPDVVWVGKGDYDMLTVQELRIDPKLYLKGYVIDSFDMYYVPKANDYVLEYNVSGNSFINDKTKVIFDQVEMGDKLHFRHIYASDPTGKNIPLSKLSAIVEIIK